MTAAAAAGGSEAALILEERARALAAPLQSEDDVENVGVVLLAAGRERYALELDHVLAIATAVTPTPVPGVPTVWRGLANVHGTLYPILDLAGYLGAQAAQEAVNQMLVLVTGAGVDAGLLVDDVSDVTWLRADAIGPAPGVARGRRVVQGVTADLIALLDVEALLSDPDLIVDDEAA